MVRNVQRDTVLGVAVQVVVQTLTLDAAGLRHSSWLRFNNTKHYHLYHPLILINYFINKRSRTILCHVTASVVFNLTACMVPAILRLEPRFHWIEVYLSSNPVFMIANVITFINVSSSSSNVGVRGDLVKIYGEDEDL